MNSPAIVDRAVLLIFPFCSTRDLDFPGLNLMRAHTMSFSKPLTIHLQPMTDDVVTVISSM